VRVPHTGGRSSFLEPPLSIARYCQRPTRQELDRDRTIRLQLARQINDPHSAATQLPLDLETRKLWQVLAGGDGGSGRNRRRRFLVHETVQGDLARATPVDVRVQARIIGIARNARFESTQNFRRGAGRHVRELPEVVVPSGIETAPTNAINDDHTAVSSPVPSRRWRSSAIIRLTR
jgi:hypothetical protein